LLSILNITDAQAGRQERIALALIYITPALWAVNYLVARWAPGEIAPHMLALCRWSLAVCVMLLFSGRELLEKWPQWRAEWWQFFVFGALGMWVCGAWVYIGARSTVAANIGLIYATTPVLIALIGWAWLHERITRTQVLGIGMALAGVVHVILKGDWANAQHLRLSSGDLWIACCAVAWAAYSILLKRWATVLSPLARLTCIAAAGSLLMIVPTLLEAAYWLPSTLSWKSVGLVVAAALIPGAGAYFAYAYMQKVLGATRVGAVLYLGPLYAAGLGYLVLGEPVALFHAVGAVLILFGIYLASRATR
jgi:drug/metabolite transporter (DMT)-like permease